MSTNQASSELDRRTFLKCAAVAGAAAWGARHVAASEAGQSVTRPNIVLVMTDDQGWGDTGYNGHPILKTPNLDAMAAAGLRFDRFYAAAPVCSPTRGSVLTGRHPNRFGCFSHGYPLRPQEVTIAQLVREAGYATGHFGKWHLNGKAGPGVPVRADDPLNPGRFGFDEWASVSNFFDLDDGFGRMGKPESFTGDSSDATMAEALGFMRKQAAANRAFLAVVWFGSPHNPHRALAADKAPYSGQPEGDQHYYGELAAVDRSVGRLRQELRSLGVADNTLVWFCSDNGGAYGTLSTGKLRGKKGSLWEGGLRVPGIIEWPARIRAPRTTTLPASTMDIFPTLVALLGLQPSRRVDPVDGMSLVPLLDGPVAARDKPICAWQGNHAAITDNALKLHCIGDGEGRVELYDIVADPRETTDLASRQPDAVKRLRGALQEWKASVQRSEAGKDYPEGRLTAPDPGRGRQTDEERLWRNEAAR